MSLPYSRSDINDRARNEWRGLCNVTLPSFTQDFAALNEAASAHDVRHAHELGYWGTLVASESGTTVEEYKRPLEVAAEAAPDGLKIVAHLSFDTVEQELDVAHASSCISTSPCRGPSTVTMLVSSPSRMVAPSASPA